MNAEDFAHLSSWLDRQIPSGRRIDALRTIGKAVDALDGEIGDRSWPDLLSIGERLA